MDFIKEFFIRLFTKNPKFFDVLQSIAAIAAFITGIPAVLLKLGIALPSAVAGVANATFAIAAIVVAILAQLPNVDPAQDGK